MDWRTPALGLAVFGATFAGGWWLGIGKMAPGVASIAKPSAEQPAAPGPAPQPARTVGLAAKPPMGKGLTDDDKLRKPVVLLAKAYQEPTCGADIKTLYVRAATNYAEVLMRSAGCNNFPRCPMGEGALDRVWQANRSAQDQAVAEAMASVHGAGGLSEKSFRGDVARAVRVIAGRDFEPGPAPVCVSPRSRSGGFRIRLRR